MSKGFQIIAETVDRHAAGGATYRVKYRAKNSFGAYEMNSWSYLWNP